MNTDPQYKALLFDLGGVILRLNPGRVLRTWSTYSGVEFNSLSSRWQIGTPYKSHETGEIGFPQLTKYLTNLLGIEITQEQWLIGWNSLFDGIFEDVIERIRMIAEELPIYAFTNTNPEHTEVWSREYAEALAPFTQIYVSSDIGRRKPDIASFQWVANDMGYSEQEILFF